MAPAAPALMQAIRAHEHAENHTQAATLALELAVTYSGQPQAEEYAKTVLANNASKLLQIRVSCDEDCKLDVDGKLQEYLAFFETPGVPHVLTATFETGSKTTRVQGEAGETREVRFEAPPPPPAPPVVGIKGQTQQSDSGTSGRPLPPLVTWIGAGVTGAVLAVTIWSAVDMYAGVDEYDKAADAARDCPEPQSTECMRLANQANDLLEAGQSREIRTNILIGATALAAVSTGVIALFLTDWSSGESREDARLGLRIEPRPGGLQTSLMGRF
ncbi:MAG TPA: hypothetical protein VJV78_27755 [Polyangiales bacterium]|nr:hypothetical protein [Polyangiales bacterium]